MSKLVLIVAQLALINQGVIQACLFKAPERSEQEKVLFGPWSDKKVKKRLVSSCECGEKSLSGSRELHTWMVDIYVSALNISCFGTIITSNLVATSHECIHFPGRNYFVFDGWQVNKSKSMARKEDIRVTDSNNPDESFEVLDIIPNPHFLAKPDSKKYVLDLLLLKLNADFSNHPTLKPICLPDSKQAEDAVAGKLGYYQNWGYNDKGTILTKKECEKEAKDGKQPAKLSPFCFHADDGLTMIDEMKTVGGPIVLKSFNRSFIVGIADGTSTKLSDTDSYLVYFTNIIPMIKYMEYRADEAKSKWCKPASLDVTDESAAWPWERASVQKTIKDRDESLDCVCGIANSGLPGRIIGGVEAIRYEFGWMASTRAFLDGPGGDKYTCGGAVINDRMVLTAAHCCVNDENGVVAAADVNVSLHTHDRARDPKRMLHRVSAVHVHPEFLKTENFQDYDIVLEDRLSFPPLPEKGIRPVCLPKMGETINLIDEMALVAGWGLTDPDDEESVADRLLKLHLPIIGLDRCRGASDYRITKHFLCAGSLDKFKDSGEGDSGGPLTIMRGQQHLEVGIVSWGTESEVDGKLLVPSLYTHVTHPDILPYIDYHATQLGDVKWCKSEQ